MRDITQQPPAIKISQQQLECVRCGAQTHATCNCGMNYVPVTQRVAEYDKENPGRSERQASADLGIPKTTVHDARQSGGHHRPPEVTGRDGKTYSATKPKRPTYTPEAGEDDLIDFVVEHFMRLSRNAQVRCALKLRKVMRGEA